MRKANMRHTILKVACIEGFYYNLTQPYFRFTKGEVYDAIIYEDGIAYGFEFCDYLTIGKEFFKYFETISDHRNKKLDSIGI